MKDKESRQFFNGAYIDTRRKIKKLTELLECNIEYLLYYIVIHYKEKELRISPIEIYEKSIGEIIDMVLGGNL